MEYQFKQGMTAPDWEMDDYGWCALLLSLLPDNQRAIRPCQRYSRPNSYELKPHFVYTLYICSTFRDDGAGFCRRPTFFPASKLRQLDKQEFFKNPTRRSMANFVGVLADLAYPKAMLSQLQDTTYMLALEDGIRAGLEEQPGEMPSSPPSI